jgi:chemotaxis response regulator CheB
VLVTRGLKENCFRSSIDALFRSAAYTYGPRVLGVVLTGYLDDDTSGLWSVQRTGGLAIVQDPHIGLSNGKTYASTKVVAPEPCLHRVAVLV